jgi:hypothetical protein
MMNKYRVAVHYEEGFTVEVTASNSKEASKVAEEFVSANCGVSESFDNVGEDEGKFVKPYHRDYWIIGEK